MVKHYLTLPLEGATTLKAQQLGLVIAGAAVIIGLGILQPKTAAAYQWHDTANQPTTEKNAAYYGSRNGQHQVTLKQGDSVKQMTAGTR